LKKAKGRAKEREKERDRDSSKRKRKTLWMMTKPCPCRDLEKGEEDQGDVAERNQQFSAKGCWGTFCALGEGSI